MDWKNQYSENEYTTHSNPNAIPRFNAIPTNGIFHRTRTNNFTICMEIQKPWIAKAFLKKKNGPGGINLSDFRLCYEATVMVWYGIGTKTEI